jgi:hypothetical protein
MKEDVKEKKLLPAPLGYSASSGFDLLKRDALS